MKRIIFGVICLVVFGLIIGIGLHLRESQIGTAFQQAEERVRQLPSSAEAHRFDPEDTGRTQAPRAPVQETDQSGAAPAPKTGAGERDVDDGIPLLEAPNELAQAGKEAVSDMADTVGQAADETVDSVEALTSEATESSGQVEAAATELIESATATADQATDEIPRAVPINPDELPVAVPEAVDASAETAVLSSTGDVAETVVAQAATAAGTAQDAAGDVAEAVTATVQETVAAVAEPVDSRVVVLGYHKFLKGKKWGPSSNTTPSEIFEQQMQALKDADYQVIPLSQLVAAMKGETSLPPKVAVITIDNGFQSVLTEAAPILEKFGYPWTFFVYTNLIGASSRTATWSDLASLIQKGVEIQSQTRSHPFLTRKRGKSESAHQEEVTKELKASRASIEQRTNLPVYALAYPFGNYDPTITEIATNEGYEAMLTVTPQPMRLRSGNNSVTEIPRFINTKQSAEFFEQFLTDEGMEITSVTPSPGTVVSEARPEITIKLADNVDLDPASVEVKVPEMSAVSAKYDPENKEITISFGENLKSRAVRVIVRGRTTEGKKVGLSWYFYYAKKLRPNE